MASTWFGAGQQRHAVRVARLGRLQVGRLGGGQPAAVGLIAAGVSA